LVLRGVVSEGSLYPGRVMRMAWDRVRAHEKGATGVLGKSKARPGAHI
jgi:hypothetical protein